MEMASFCLKIRHVFGFTSLTEQSIGAGPPVIIQLSGPYVSCDTDLSSTHPRAPFTLQTWDYEQEKNET